MFEISFGEIMLISVVALVVLGPERLPTVARTLGALVGRAQRFVASVKADMHREASLAGLDGLKNDIVSTAHEFRASLESEIDSARALLREEGQMVEQEAEAVRTLAEEARRDVDALSDSLAELAAAAGKTEAAPAAAESATGAAPVVDENQLDIFEHPPSPVVPGEGRR